MVALVTAFLTEALFAELRKELYGTRALENLPTGHI